MNNLEKISVQQANLIAVQTLATDEAVDDARYLLSFVMQRDFTWLRTWPETLLDKHQILLLNQVLQRRLNGEPIAYITGERDFWTLRLKTNASTLIPRPETELLVELAIEFLSERQSTLQGQNILHGQRILDLGTGTGAIALAIASERQQDHVTAVDFYPNAVELAQQNAMLNQINNIEILQSDWFNNLKETKFDLIVSNPPYIEEDDPHLQQGDLIFEPPSALVSSDKGLADIRIIIGTAKYYLVQHGQLMIEHGYQQAKQVKKIFSEQGYVNLKTVQDLAGLDRITIGQTAAE